MSVGLVPAFLLITGIGAAGAQTRTAPSIGDAIRRETGQATSQPGVRTRGVDLPGQQNCDARNGDYKYDGRYDRDDRGRDKDKYKNKDRREDKRERQRREQWEREHRSGQYGCCTDGTYNRNGSGTIDARRGNGSGTIARSGTVLRGTTVNGNNRYDQRTPNPCGYDQRQQQDHRQDRDHDHDRDHDFDRSHD
jgi:hypothetical protein